MGYRFHHQVTNRFQNFLTIDHTNSSSYKVTTFSWTWDEKKL